MTTITKRITSTLLCLLMAVSAFPNSVYAEETHNHGAETEISVATEENSTSGTIGESSVAWSLDTATGHLTITGSGDCATFTSADDQPWASVREQITEVWFMDMDSLEIPNLAYWFDGCVNLTMAEIPYSTPVIGVRAFADCPALATVVLYHQDGNFQIHDSAFAVDTLSPLEVRYISSVEGPADVLKSYNWAEDNRTVTYADVYGMTVLDEAYCPRCDGTYSYTLEYEQWSENVHAIRLWSDNCGYDMLQGASAEDHTMSGGVCTKCGYEDGSGNLGGGDSSCAHDWTSLEWDVCRWYEVCDDCGAVLDTGIEHGRYYTEYDGCTWYEYCGYCDSVMDYGTEHGDTYTDYDGCTWYERCENCDIIMDSGVSHGSTETVWDGCNWTKECSVCGEYMGSGTTHGSTTTTWNNCNWTDKCSVCGLTIDSGTTHSTYSYGAWEYYSTSQHRRLYACDRCGQGSYSYGSHSKTNSYSQYSDTQHQYSSYCSTCSSTIGSVSYSSHSFTYGSWSSYSSSHHYRTKSCSTCGYSTTEYASHSLSYGSLSNYSSTQHRQYVSCSTCGYGTYNYYNHSFSYGSWTNYSDTQHSRTKTCSCGYSGSETASHSFTYGNWSSISSSQHSRSKSCSCGYSGTETASHSFTNGNWTYASTTSHSRSRTCSCGYSTTETAEHSFTNGEWSTNDTQHWRTNTCTCGYSTEESEGHADTNGDGYCDTCSYLMARFSVTVPAVMNLILSKDGQIYAATNATITNNSTGAVTVSEVKLTADNGWTIVPYDTNMADERVDTKLIGFKVNDAESLYSGSTENLTLSSEWDIAKSDSISLEYDAVVSATSEAIDEQVLTVVFVLNWA